jgi:hypothetical protein
MTRSGQRVALVAWVFVCVFGGCGSTKPKTRAIDARPFSFDSPALTAEGGIPSRYACNEKIWLPLRWGRLPADAGELVLFAREAGTPTPTSHHSWTADIVAGSAIVGLKSTLHNLAVGRLPSGAVVARERRVATCSARLPGGKYVFTLFATPRAWSALREMRRLKSLRAFLAQVQKEAIAESTFTASYEGT